ncbi:MAG: acyltransferase [Actinobacteria bacterium]|nr:acyltransferase [Actinomycetota bacterium]
MTSALRRSVGSSPGMLAREHREHPETAGFRPDIEGMRALAVLSVVLYHADLLGVHGGFVGVDVFFVISGFLITRLLLDSVGDQGIRALASFYARRIRRLLPAAMTVVVATVVAARFWAPPLSVRPISIDAIFTTFYGLNYRLAVEGTQYLNEGSAVSPLQHFWSLAVEEQFYLCWPILIVVMVFLGRRHRTALLGVLLAVIVVVSFRYSVVVTGTDAPWAYFSLATRAWELGMGALVALGASRLARLPGSIAVAGTWLALAAVLAAAFAYNGRTPYPGSAAALPVAGAAALIACGCSGQRGAGVLLSARPWRFAGRMSYSWYLWHWPMLVLAPMILGHALRWPERLTVVAASLAAAVITFTLIENPARSLRLPNLQWFAGGLALSGSAVAAAVLVLGNLPSLAGTGAAATVVHAPAATRTVISEMKAAIRAGLNTTDAPRNLTPAPARARADVPYSSHDGCHASISAITQGPCVSGDRTGRDTAVLFGDSHMQQWQPAFTRAGGYAHWRIVNLTKSGCAPGKLTEFIAQLNRIYTECNTWRALTLRRIEALNPAVVVLAGSDNEAAANVSPATYAGATVSTVRTLQRTTTAKIVYLEDTPYPRYDVASCVAAHLHDVRACNLPRGRAYPYPARHQAINQALRKLGGVTLADPAGWICASNACPAVVGNLLVFRDSQHLSAAFSRWLTPMITSLLDKLKPAHAG